MGRKRENRKRIVAHVKKSTNRDIRKRVERDCDDLRTIGRVLDNIFDAIRKENSVN